MSITMTVTEKQDTCPFLNSLCKLYIKDEEMAKALMQGAKYRHRKRHEQKKKKMSIALGHCMHSVLRGFRKKCTK